MRHPTAYVAFGKIAALYVACGNTAALYVAFGTTAAAITFGTRAIYRTDGWHFPVAW